MTVRVPAAPVARWSLSLYPSAGEAGGSFIPTYRRAVVHVPGVPAQNPERARAEAARRARTKVRRYCAANGLSKLGTLTYGPPRCTDPAQLREDVGVFFRRLRTALGGRPLPYVWVPELHKDGVHLHVHFAVARFIRKALIRDVWGRGHVGIKLISDLPVGSTSWDESRRAAGYLSKYVAKAFDDPVFGRHRYDLAQGFQPPVHRLEGRSSDDVLAQACALMGGRLPVVRWSSADKPGWQAPPAVWFAWAA